MQSDLFNVKVNFSAYKSQGDAWRNDYHSMKNHLRALNSLYQVR